MYTAKRQMMITAACMVQSTMVLANLGNAFTSQQEPHQAPQSLAFNNW